MLTLNRGQLEQQLAQTRTTVRASMQQMANSVVVVNKQLTVMDQRMSSVERSTRRMGHALTAAWATLGGVTVGRFTQDLVDAGRQYDNLIATLQVSQGTVKASEDAFVRQAVNAQRLGVNLAALAEQYGKTLAAAKGTALEGAAAEDIFNAVAESASVLSLNAEKTGGILNAIQQIMSKGKVQAEELRGQLGERLAGAFNIAAQSMGYTNEQMDKLMEQGLVPAGKFLPAFAAELRKQFGASLPDAMKRSGAAIERFNNAIFLAKISFAKSGFLDGIIASIERLQKVMESTEFQRSSAAFGANIGAMMEAIAKNADKVLMVLGALAGARLASSLARIAGLKGSPALGVVAGGAALGAAAGAPEILSYLTGSGAGDAGTSVASRVHESQVGAVRVLTEQLKERQKVLDSIEEQISLMASLELERNAKYNIADMQQQLGLAVTEADKAIAKLTERDADLERIRMKLFEHIQATYAAGKAPFTTGAGIAVRPEQRQTAALQDQLANALQERDRALRDVEAWRKRTTEIGGAIGANQAGLVSPELVALLAKQAEAIKRIGDAEAQLHLIRSQAEDSAGKQEAIAAEIRANARLTDSTTELSDKQKEFVSGVLADTEAMERRAAATARGADAVHELAIQEEVESAIIKGGAENNSVLAAAIEDLIRKRVGLKDATEDMVAAERAAESIADKRLQSFKDMTTAVGDVKIANDNATKSFLDTMGALSQGAYAYERYIEKAEQDQQVKELLVGTGLDVNSQLAKEIRARLDLDLIIKRNVDSVRALAKAYEDEVIARVEREVGLEDEQRELSAVMRLRDAAALAALRNDRKIYDQAKDRLDIEEKIRASGFLGTDEEGPLRQKLIQAMEANEQTQAYLDSIKERGQVERKEETAAEALAKKRTEWLEAQAYRMRGLLVIQELLTKGGDGNEALQRFEVRGTQVIDRITGAAAQVDMTYESQLDKVNDIIKATEARIELDLLGNSALARQVGTIAQTNEQLERQNKIIEDRKKSEEDEEKKMARRSDRLAEELYRRERPPATEYADNMTALDQLIAKREGAGKPLTGEEVGYIRRQIDEELIDGNKRMLASLRDWRSGAVLALDEYADNATNTARNVGEAFSQSFRSAEDALVEFTMTGKFEIEEFLLSIVEMTNRILIRQFLTGPLSAGVSDVLSGGSFATGLMGALGFGGTGQLGGQQTKSISSKAAFDVATMASIFHDGGEVGRGGQRSRSVDSTEFVGAPRLHQGLMPDEYAAILQKGEKVIPKGGSLEGVTNIYQNFNTDARGANDPQLPAKIREQARAAAVDVMRIGKRRGHSARLIA